MQYVSSKPVACSHDFCYSGGAIICTRCTVDLRVTDNSSYWSLHNSAVTAIMSPATIKPTQVFV